MILLSEWLISEMHFLTEWFYLRILISLRPALAATRERLEDTDAHSLCPCYAFTF